MKIVSIDTELFKKYKGDPEVLTKSKRPYVLVIRLKYKEKVIVDNCQTYLDSYAKGQHPQYATDIDFLLSQLFSND